MAVVLGIIIIVVVLGVVAVVFGRAVRPREQLGCLGWNLMAA
jgi:Sec-independent protein translocase protein TatA